MLLLILWLEFVHSDYSIKYIPLYNRFPALASSLILSQLSIAFALGPVPGQPLMVWF